MLDHLDYFILSDPSAVFNLQEIGQAMLEEHRFHYLLLVHHLRVNHTIINLVVLHCFLIVQVPFLALILFSLTLQALRHKLHLNHIILVHQFFLFNHQ